MSARAFAAAALLAVAFPATADAAYAPELEFRVDPATPRAQPSVTAILRSQPGDNPTRTQVIRYPRELRFNPAFSVKGCRPPEEDAQACPESSRIGTASAETEFGPFSGDVYLTEDFRTLIFLRGFAGLVQSKVVGHVQVTADGSVETVLDDLPRVRSTFGQVRLEGGPRSLILLPRRCGSFPLSGRFTSHEGEIVTSNTAIEVRGCDTEPRIETLAARKRGRSIALVWSTTATGQVRVELERRVASRPFDRWRRVATAGVASRQGRNRLRIKPSAPRRLRRGIYRVTVRALSSGGRLTDTERTELRVVQKRGRRPAR